MQQTPIGTWHSLSPTVLTALKGVGVKITRKDRGGYLRSNRDGPRVRERIRLLEFIDPSDGPLLVSVVVPAVGGAWPQRTLARVMPALRLLDAGLADVAALPLDKQAAAFAQLVAEGRAAVPEPAKRKRRRRKFPPGQSIHVVSGGLPSLGKRR